MVQYEKINGVPKLKANRTTAVSGGKYIDSAGNVKDVKDLANYRELIKRLSENSHSDADLEKLGHLVKSTTNGNGAEYSFQMAPPKRNIVSIAVSVAYPYINYHARYMRECTQIASEWLVKRLLRQKDLMRGISAYKAHVNGQDGEAQPA